MANGGYAAILARLQAPQLQLHCDEALRLELMQVRLRLQDVSTAMQRLRDVGHAAMALGSNDSAVLSATLLAETERMQRDLSRAVAAFGSVEGTRTSLSVPSQCCSCGGRETGKLRTTQEEEKFLNDEPLLATPDTAALSPPRRHKPPRTKSQPQPQPPHTKPPPKAVSRRKLVIHRKSIQIAEDEAVETTTPTASAVPRRKRQPTRTAKSEKLPVKKDEPDDVVIVEDYPQTDDDDDEEGDLRTRLQRKIDACWPLATALGALEMQQRRGANSTDLVRRVCALFRTLLACDVESMASRSMRSVLVKARDSLAVALSLLSLHGITDTNAPAILALVKAVEAASEKHATLQKHVVPFRNSLADIEVALLTRSYAKLSPQQPLKETKAARKKLRAG